MYIERSAENAAEILFVVTSATEAAGIEMFYNPKRKHVRNGMLSPVTFERQHKTANEGV